MTDKDKNPEGRPTKYTPEIVEAAYAYIDGYATHGHMIPSIQGMSIVLCVDETTLQDWAKQGDKEFSRILAKCKTHQHFALVNKGLGNEINSNITKLVLGKHGYHDKLDTEHSGGFNVTIPAKAAAIL